MNELTLPPLRGSRYNPVSGHYSKVLTDFLLAIRAEPLEDNPLYADFLKCRSDMLMQKNLLSGFKFRCMIVSMAAEPDVTVRGISEQLKTDPKVVRTWLKRFTKYGIEGLYDKPRSGRPVKYDYTQIKDQLIQLVSQPPASFSSDDPKLNKDLKASEEWTVSLLARVFQMPMSTVFRVLQKNSIELHPKKSKKKKKEMLTAERALFGDAVDEESDTQASMVVAKFSSKEESRESESDPAAPQS